MYVSTPSHSFEVNNLDYQRTQCSYSPVNHGILIKFHPSISITSMILIYFLSGNLIEGSSQSGCLHPLGVRFSRRECSKQGGLLGGQKNVRELRFVFILGELWYRKL